MTLREKIESGKKMIGMHICLNDVATARIAALSGYDYIWIDLEHSNLSLENLLSFILVVQATGTAAIVRVPMDDLTYTKKVLEMGPDGIIFPMIRTAEQANRLIDFTLYPPYGSRGYGPQAAVGYGFESSSDYVANTCKNICRFIQIEHKEAVENLEEIIKNPYIDGYIFGPNDLSGSLGMLGEPFREEPMALIRHTIRVLRENGKYIGASIGETSPEAIDYWHKLGVDMISAGSDFRFLQMLSDETAKTLRRVHTGTFDKIFYDQSNLTPNIHASLKPPYFFGPEMAAHPFFSAEKRRWQSAPCICKAKNGDLYCTYSGDNHGGDEAPNNYNVVMKSTDGGESWRTITILDHPDSVRMHGPIVWCDPKDTLWLFWAQSYNWWDGRGGVWAVKLLSEENGTPIWSKPRRLADGVLAHTPVALENGDILLPVSIWKKWKNVIHPYPYYGNAGVYRSTDGGESFHYVGGAVEPTSTFDENAIVERKDGSLYMIIRCEGAIAWSESFDGGVTWSVPKKLMDHTGSRSYMAKFPSGNYLLVTNDDTKERSRMTAFLSTDECKSWQHKLLLDERCAVSYPAGCIDKNGRVYVSYDFNRYSDEELYFASFTEEDILRGELTHKDSFLKRLIIKGGEGKASDKVFESGDAK